MKHWKKRSGIMNTPPKARKFRIRKIIAPAAPASALPEGDDMPFAPRADDDGFGDLNMTAPRPDPAPLGKDAEAEIAAIRAEGLTARQVRLARRQAVKHGIEATTDFEAVMLLRRKGVDPFQRENILNLVESDARHSALVPQSDAGWLPTTTDPKVHNLPSTEVNAEAQRAMAIMHMQRDIVRRRRQSLLMLMTRLAFFVLVPTLMAGWYFFNIATPLYATKSEFLVQQAESNNFGGGGLASMFRGTQFATSQDAITVQSFLQSRDAMLRLDTEEGYKAHFSQDFIDPIQRLKPNASNEAAYKLYRRNVKITFDPTEGIIKMEVIAADPASSERFSKALLRFAEAQVDQLTQRVREDQMRGARDSYDDAEAKVNTAAKQVQTLQEKLGVLDPKVEGSMVMSGVAELEGALRQKQLMLQQLLDNAKPNQARVEGVKGDISRLRDQIAELRASLTEGTAQTESLAQVTGELRIAETELQTRQLMLGQSLQQLETARIEANRQVRYLTLGVSPIAPDEPTYPRVFENTALAFLIFAGIYLMLSLTASILREQVTA